MKIKLSIAVLLLLVAVIGGIVYAQTGQDNATFWPARFEFTEEQKAELNNIWSQMQDLREQMMDKMVEFGAVSPERAQWMKDGWKLQQEEGAEFGPGYGPCHGVRQGYGPGRMHRRHMMGGWGW